MSLSDYQSSVPAPSLTGAGFVAPAEQDILAGVQDDISAALGGGENKALTTPQGQIAMSEAAILGDYLAQMLLVLNGIDPSRAFGRMQDAIGRIYFMTRRPATPTVVKVSIVPTSSDAITIKAGTNIAWDQGGNVYALINDLNIPADTTSIDAEVQNIKLGPIPCGSNTLSLYQGGLGIASLSNEEPGALGSEAEQRLDFEQRRKNSVMSNAVSVNGALAGYLQSLPNVTDAYVVDNQSNGAEVIGGVTIPAHTVYVVVIGGDDKDIGHGILIKKSPGIPTMGKQIVTVFDDNPAYSPTAKPSYTFKFDRSEPISIQVKVTLANNPNIPNDASTIIAKTISETLSSGKFRVRIGATLFVGPLWCAVGNLGDWSKPLNIELIYQGKSSTEITLPINQIPSVTSNDVLVTLQ